MNNREKLLNMTAGGTGRSGFWIERVIYDATDSTPEHEGYIVHTEVRSNGREMQISGTLHTCRLLCLIGDDKQRTAEQVEAEAAAIPYSDYGRHITADMQGV